MGTVELTGKVRELKELKMLAEELQAEITVLENQIKEEMAARSVEEMAVDIFKVRWVTVVSNRIDTTALKKLLPDIADKFTKQTQSRRFTVA